MEASFGNSGEIFSVCSKEKVVADAIKYHDRIVHRISDDTEESGDEEEVHFKGGKTTDDREDSQSDQRVVEGGDHGTDSERPGAETLRNFPEGKSEVEDDGC